MFSCVWCKCQVVVLSRSLPDVIRSAYRMGYHGNDLGLQVGSSRQEK